MKKLLILSLALGSWACDSSSSKKTLAPAPENPTNLNEPDDPEEDSVKFDLDGNWGVSVFQKRCHSIYSFSPKGTSKSEGDYTTTMICSDYETKQTRFEESQGSYRITEAGDSRAVVELQKTDSSCVTGGDFNSKSTVKLFRTESTLQIQNVDYRKIPDELMNSSLSKLDMKRGCFINGEISNFTAVEVSNES